MSDSAGLGPDWAASANRPPAETVPALIRRWADRTPGAPALSAPSRKSLDYEGLWELMLSTAHRLNGSGIDRRDRVALVLPNSPEMAAAFLSVTAVACCGPLNPSYRSNELEFFLRDMRAKAIIVPEGDGQTEAREVAERLGISVLDLRAPLDGPAGAFTLLGGPNGTLAEVSWPQSSDVALVLHTSGTTSRPKLVPLTHGNLISSAGHIAGTLRLTAADRCLNVMPLFHVHGLAACLLAPLQAGGSVACAPSFQAPSFFGWIRELGPTWYSAVPTMHQAVLARANQDSEDPERFGLRFIRSSSAPLPLTLLGELEEAFGAPVIESYGMTEASHQIASNPLPPAIQKPGAVGPAAGPQIGIMDSEGGELREGERGEVVIRGPNVMGGYENNPDANEASFQGEWFRTGDEGYLDSDGYLFITGRLKEIINKGGEKISPREVDEVMIQHEAVSEALAFSVPDARLGEEVGLAVVLQTAAEVGEQDLRRFAAQRLADFKVPGKVVILDEIPKGPTGKPQRIGLAEKLGLTAQDGDRPRRRRRITPPRTPSEQVVADLWRQVLRLKKVGVEERFLDVGGDSLLASLLLSRVRDQVQIELDMVDFFAAPTVAEQAELIDRILFSSIEGGRSDTAPQDGNP